MTVPILHPACKMQDTLAASFPSQRHQKKSMQQTLVPCLLSPEFLPEIHTSTSASTTPGSAERYGLRGRCKNSAFSSEPFFFFLKAVRLSSSPSLENNIKPCTIAWFLSPNKKWNYPQKYFFSAQVLVFFHYVCVYINIYIYIYAHKMLLWAIFSWKKIMR